MTCKKATGASVQDFSDQEPHWPLRSHCPISFPLVCEIEKTAKCFIGIESKCTKANLDRCHTQLQSPLFQIPAELRNLIYDYVSLPAVEPSTLRYGSYAIETLGCYPVCTANLSWLQTCRLLWLEANAFVFRNAEPTFFRLYDPPHLHHFLRNLTPLNVEHLQRIHIGQEVFHLAVDHTVLKYLEDTTLQIWPPEVTITLTAYPYFASTDDFADWIMQIITHQKLAASNKLQINIHAPCSQATSISFVAETIRRERRIADWEPLAGTVRETFSWTRKWGDNRPGYRRGTPVNMEYRSFNLDFRRVPGTGKARSQKFEPGLDADCWHLLPWRTIFRDRRSSVSTRSTHQHHTRQYLEKWRMQNSLLKFME